MTASRIAFDRVWKKFHRGQVHDSLRDLIPSVTRRLLGRGDRQDLLSDGDFWALQDLSFDIPPGKCLGIIGPNGSGKSTTLKILTRILEPTRGTYELVGRAGTLIEVSAGFHGDLTGRENVFLQGAIMGMTRNDILRKFDQIVEFAGVEDAIDTPVKRYSSGMNARLGFSIAAHLEPDVLIIDEVLAVGDLSFQDRAFGRIRDLAQSGIPVVIVSHQLDRIAELCTDALLLVKGEVLARGAPNDVIAHYVQLHATVSVVKQTGIVVFHSVEIPTEPVVSGERFTIRVRGRANQELADKFDPVVVRIRSIVSNQVVFATGCQWGGVSVTGPGEFDVEFDLQANVQPGTYSVEIVAINRDTTSKITDTKKGGILQIAPSTKFAGAAGMNARVHAHATARR